MAEYSFTGKPRSPFILWVMRAMPHRRIIVGSEHGARYYSLSRTAQLGLIALAVTGLASVGWLALALKAGALKEHAQALKLDLDSPAELDEQNVVVAERNRLKTANGALNERLADVGAKIARLFETSAGLPTVTPSGAVPEFTQDPVIGSSQLTLWTSKIEIGLGALEQQMSALRSSRTHVIQLLKGHTSQQNERLEGIITATGLNVEPLLKAVRHRKPPRVRPGEEAEQLRLVSDGGNLVRDASFIELEDQLQRLDDLQYVIKHLPVVPPLENMVVTSSFGKRRDPFTKRWKKHEGLDFRAPRGTLILAPADGTVTFAGRHGGYGYFVEIDHGAGVRTRYGHMSKVLVKKRQRISLGDRIGKVGNSGRSTGVHLHYEIRYHGRPQDPMNFIKAGWHVYKR